MRNKMIYNSNGHKARTINIFTKYTYYDTEIVN